MLDARIKALSLERDSLKTSIIAYQFDLKQLEFKKYPNDYTYVPLLSKNSFESGTGHNTVIKYKNEWYIVYHGRDIEEENETFDNRSMRIAKMIVDDEKLTVVRNNNL